jgi:transcriptional regulator NrdR family protein
MICPSCKSPDVWVKDSRPTERNNGIRRRRFCKTCSHVWSTVELEAERVPGKTGLEQVPEPRTLQQEYEELESAIASMNDILRRVRLSISNANKEES